MGKGGLAMSIQEISILNRNKALSFSVRLHLKKNTNIFQKGNDRHLVAVVEGGKPAMRLNLLHNLALLQHH